MNKAYNLSAHFLCASKRLTNFLHLHTQARMRYGKRLATDGPQLNLSPEARIGLQTAGAKAAVEYR